MWRVSVCLVAASILGSISACSSSTRVSSVDKPIAPPETFSVALNSTSVFMGASIVQYWPLPLHNGGIAGQPTAQVLERFKSEVLGHGYARVIILCGTTDVVQKTPNLIAEATANLAAMGKIATDSGIEVVLSKLPPAVSNGVDLSPTISILNDSIAQLASQQAYLVVDYFTPMYGHPEFFVDGIHPKTAGYAVMEKALSAVVWMKVSGVPSAGLTKTTSLGSRRGVSTAKTTKGSSRISGVPWTVPFLKKMS